MTNVLNAEQRPKGRGNWGARLTPEHIAKMRAARLAANPPEQERFWNYVARANHTRCWTFLGHVNNCGYGQFALTTPPGLNLKTKQVLAHRYSWELAGNELPEWPMVIDHICKNPRCVNPRHLRVVHQHRNCVELAKPTTPARINKMKTECIRGHPFTPENTFINGRGHRQCKACTSIRAREYWNAKVNYATLFPQD